MESKYTSFDDLPLTLRAEDLMTILGIGRNTAYELVRSGQIKSVILCFFERAVKKYFCARSDEQGQLSKTLNRGRKIVRNAEII